jgi:hypothetical protein
VPNVHLRALCRYKRDLRRVYRFYASIGAKSRVKASGDLSQTLKRARLSQFIPGGRMGILQWGNLVAGQRAAPMRQR